MEVIIGSVASGKTTKLADVISEYSKNNKQVAFLSGDDTLESLVEKLIKFNSVLQNVTIKPFETFDKVVSEVLSDDDIDIVCIDNVQLATIKPKVNKDKELKLKLDILAKLEELTEKRILTTVQTRLDDPRLKGEKLIQVEYKTAN